MSDLFKTVQVSPDVSEYIYAGPVPSDVEVMYNEARATTDLFNVLVWGRGKEQGEQSLYSVPHVDYATVSSWFADGSGFWTNKTYTGINRYNTPATFYGRFIPLEWVINTVYGIQLVGQQGLPRTTPFALNDLSTSNTIVTLSSGGFTIRITGEQLLYTRNEFSNPSSPTQVFPGFLQPTDTLGGTPTTGAVRFVMGQVAANEQNQPTFVSLSEGGFTLDISNAALLPKWGPITAYAQNASGDIDSYAPGTIIPLISSNPMANKVKFNIPLYDYLNQTKLYFAAVSTSGADRALSIYIDDFVNKQAPMYRGGFYDPAGTAGTWSNLEGVSLSSGNYNLKVMAYGYGAVNSDVYSWSVTVT